MNATRVVFSSTGYAVLALVIFAGLLFPLLLLSEYIFLEPYFVGHIPQDGELGLALIVVLSALSAVVLPMNVYRIRVLRSSRRKMGGGVAGSIIGAVAGACSCGPVGFAVISTFGSVGATASAFVSNYEIPLRIAAIALLLITYYTTNRSLAVECRLNN